MAMVPLATEEGTPRLLLDCCGGVVTLLMEETDRIVVPPMAPAPMLVGPV